MKTSILDIREEVYERLGVAELPPADHVHYAACVKVIKRELTRCLEGYPWWFARKRIRLEGEGNCYLLPEDMLSVLWCSVNSYELLGRELRCAEEGGVELAYTSSAALVALEKNGMADLPGYYVDCVVFKAAERLAPMVLGRPDVMISMKQLYDDCVDAAKLADVRQYASNGRVVHPMDACLGQDGEFYPYKPTIN